MKYKAIFFSTIVFVCGLLSVSSVFANKNDDIMNAMRDELKRSMKNLQLESLQRPYYIEYIVSVKKNYSVHASLGALVDYNDNEKTTLTVRLRVGDYKFDNTNFLDFEFSFFGSGDEEERFTNRTIPNEIDYGSLRREIWLATDAAYKEASEFYAKKEAALKNRIRKDTTYDFIQMPPEKFNFYSENPPFDKDLYVKICKNLSFVFTKYPSIQSSQASIEYNPETVYYLNSEGREYIRTEAFCGVEVSATTQSEDGMPLSDFYSAYGFVPNDLPKQDSLVKGALAIGENLDKLVKSKNLEETYSGPVLVEGQAAAEVFAQIFAPNFVTQRASLTEDRVQEPEQNAAFQSKIGGRVLPEFLSVRAIPNKKGDSTLKYVGSYLIDDDGLMPQDVDLVTNGYLKALLSTRVPTRRVKYDNGHNRGGGAMLSVIEMNSDTTHQKSPRELKEQLLTLCRDRDLPYGIIIRKAVNQNIYYTSLMRISNVLISSYSSKPKIDFVQIYKVFPNGREELIKGCESDAFTVQSFKDIIGVSDRKYAMNYLAPSISSPYLFGGEQYVASTVIVPDMLFEDGEIKAKTDDFPKPPFLPSPLTMEKQNEKPNRK